MPYRNRKNEEYGVDTFHADKYAPAMWGLVLSLPKKRLFMLSKVADPGEEVKPPSSSTHPIDDSISARQLTAGDGKLYCAAPEGLAHWGIYQHDFETGRSRLLKGAFEARPHELFYWNGKLLFSTSDSSLWIWDGNEVEQLQSIKKRGGKAAAQFTAFEDEVYFVSPPSRKPAMGGELWKTDGTLEGTVKVKDGLWMLLGGSKSWQSNVGHARSLQVAMGKLFFATCETDPSGKPLSRQFGLWTSNGTTESTVRLLEAPLTVVATDHHNSLYGSYIGIEYDERLYFSAGGYLWESDGTPDGTVKSPLKIRSPNHFAISQDRLVFNGRSMSSPRRASGAELIIYRGVGSESNRFPTGAKRLRQLTAVAGSESFYFAGDDGQHGEELWVSDGSPNGTRMVKDLNPGSYGAMIDNLVALDGHLYFSATDRQSGNELWRTGKVKGEPEVADLIPGSNGSFPSQFTTDDGRLFFYTTGRAQNRQLWQYEPGGASAAPIFGTN